MTLATAMTAVALAGVAGCTSSSSGDADPSPSTTISSEVPADPAKALVGVWHDPQAEWVLHFNDDGTFVEDFRGIENFRVGTYSVDGDEVSIKGDDGNTDVGTMVGTSIEFKLGTLVRK